MTTRQITPESSCRRMNDTRGAALLRYIRHPIDSARELAPLARHPIVSIRETRMARKKTPAQKARSMIKQGREQAQYGNDEGAGTFFDGAAKTALQVMSPVSRAWIMLEVFDAELQSGRPTFAGTKLMLAEGEIAQIENPHEQATLSLALWQKRNQLPISPPASQGPFMSWDEYVAKHL